MHLGGVDGTRRECIQWCQISIFPFQGFLSGRTVMNTAHDLWSNKWTCNKQTHSFWKCYYIYLKETSGRIKWANLHLVTIPSTQTRLPRNRALSVRGETCLFPKLPSNPTWNSSNCLAYVASIEATKSFRALWKATSSQKAFFKSLYKKIKSIQLKTKCSPIKRQNSQTLAYGYYSNQ